MEVLYVVFGWFLGLMSPLIVDWIRDKSLKKQIGKAFETELAELRYRLAVVVYQLAKHNGRFNRSIVEWCHSTLTECGTGEIADELRSSFDKILKLSDGQIEQLGHPEKKDGAGKTLGTFHLPFFDSHLDRITLFSVATQQALLDIKNQLGFLNDQIDQMRKHQDMTFTVNLSKENFSRVEENLDIWFTNIEDRAHTIADKIGALKTA